MLSAGTRTSQVNKIALLLSGKDLFELSRAKTTSVIINSPKITIYLDRKAMEMIINKSDGKKVIIGFLLENDDIYHDETNT